MGEDNCPGVADSCLGVDNLLEVADSFLAVEDNCLAVGNPLEEAEVGVNYYPDSDFHMDYCSLHYTLLYNKWIITVKTHNLVHDLCDYD